jgi:parallel beta-helix repeat protein
LNNHIYDHAGAGVFVGNWAGTNNVISGNTIHGNVIGGIPGLNGNGIELDRAYSATVTNNVVYNNEATGIKIVRAPGNAVFKITYNVITGNPAGVLNDSWLANTVLVEVTCNDIINNGIGVQNNENIIITAEINWWGSTTGAYHPVLNPAGTGDLVSDNVDFSPWGLHADPCRSRTSQQQNTPGYGQHMCPLARKNFQESTSLLMEVENQLTQAQALDLDTAEIEELLDEAKALLEQSRLFCKNSQNCIAGNTLALQAQVLLREIQDRLESMLA